MVPEEHNKMVHEPCSSLGAEIPHLLSRFLCEPVGKKSGKHNKVVRRGEIEHHIKLTQKDHTRVRKDPRLELALLEKSPRSANTRIKRTVPKVLSTLDGGLDLGHDFKVRKHQNRFIVLVVGDGPDAPIQDGNLCGVGCTEKTGCLPRSLGCCVMVANDRLFGK